VNGGVLFNFGLQMGELLAGKKPSNEDACSHSTRQDDDQNDGIDGH
jgi:hypothetical protein